MEGHWAATQESYRAFGHATRGMTISFPSAEFKTKKEIGMISETRRLPLFSAGRIQCG